MPTVNSLIYNYWVLSILYSFSMVHTVWIVLNKPYKQSPKVLNMMLAAAACKVVVHDKVNNSLEYFGRNVRMRIFER